MKTLLFSICASLVWAGRAQQVLIVENVTTNNVAVYSYSGSHLLQCVAPMQRVEIDYAATNDPTVTPGSVALQQPMTGNGVADSSGAYYRPFQFFPTASECVGFYGHLSAPVFFESPLNVITPSITNVSSTNDVSGVDDSTECQADFNDGLVCGAIIAAGLFCLWMIKTIPGGCDYE